MENIRNFLESLLSRKWLAAIISAVVAFGNARWDWGLTVQEVWSVIVPLLAYIGVEGVADYKSRKAG